VLIIGNLIYNEIFKIPGITNKWKSDYLKKSLIVDDAEDSDSSLEDFKNTDDRTISISLEP